MSLSVTFYSDSSSS